MSPTPKQLLQLRKLNRYKQWYKGKLARSMGAPCASANGDYLDGFYSESVIPDFLTQVEASELRAIMMQENTIWRTMVFKTI